MMSSNLILFVCLLSFAIVEGKQYANVNVNIIQNGNRSGKVYNQNVQTTKLPEPEPTKTLEPKTMETEEPTTVAQTTTSTNIWEVVTAQNGFGPLQYAFSEDLFENQKVTDELLTYNGSVEACKELGGWLAYPRYAEELETIWKIVTNKQNTWIGVTANIDHENGNYVSATNVKGEDSTETMEKLWEKPPGTRGENEKYDSWSFECWESVPRGYGDIFCSITPTSASHYFVCAKLI